MKDNFSNRSGQYQKFRPGYPAKLIDFLVSVSKNNETAWDCGTGNGQVALELAKHFDKVYATDISKNQLAQAVKQDNILYSVQPAEKISFPPAFFDLITVAQAIHWFDFGLFYKEVSRTIKPSGKIAVMGYGLFNCDEETDRVIKKFYHEIIGSYWDKERKYIDENYRTIPFPFKEIECPKFENVFEWTFEQLLGYLGTWSAVQHFIKANHRNPVEDIDDVLLAAWGKNETKTIRFPIFLRLGEL